MRLKIILTSSFISEKKRFLSAVLWRSFGLDSAVFLLQVKEKCICSEGKSRSSNCSETAVFFLVDYVPFRDVPRTVKQSH